MTAIGIPAVIFLLFVAYVAISRARGPTTPERTSWVAGAPGRRRVVRSGLVAVALRTPTGGQQ